MREKAHFKWLYMGQHTCTVQYFDFADTLLNIFHQMAFDEGMLLRVCDTSTVLLVKQVGWAVG